MRLNKIKNIIKEQILLLEKEKWFTSIKAANDACVDCPDCCQVSDYQTNWLGVIIAVKMACVGCPDGASRGTVIHPNGQFHGVLSKPEGDPFNPEPQMMARGNEKLCPCGPGGDMIPCSECNKSSGMMSLDRRELPELYGTLYEDVTLLNEEWITSKNPIKLQNFCTDCVDSGKCCYTDSARNSSKGVTVGCFACSDKRKPSWFPVVPDTKQRMGNEKSCPCENGDMLPECCPKKSIREEMIDDLKDQVIIPNKTKPKSGGCGCGKKR
tara:strand:+ start:278 stop:1081 length:804 start_codon:yes stop_codon:yes gene_type:complete